MKPGSWLDAPRALVIALGISSGAAYPALAADDLLQCRTIENATARLRCYQNLSPVVPDAPSSGLSAPPANPQTIGQWRLVRTPHPRGEKEAISITRPGELGRSDVDFAGLMIRCADTDIEVLPVLIRPLPPRDRPRVSINGATFEGRVVPPGSAILLPREVSALARERWRSLPNLSFEVEEGGTVTKGLVSLQDFDAALGTLTAACSARK